MYDKTYLLKPEHQQAGITLVEAEDFYYLNREGGSVTLKASGLTLERVWDEADLILECLKVSVS